jgi:hypothetical protein
MMAALAALEALLGGSISAGIMAVLGGTIVLPVVAMASLVAALKTVIDWLVNGKLICLYRDASHARDCGDNGGQICVVGQIIDTEDVGQDKNPIEDLDNDYAMNVILAPLTVADFWKSRQQSMQDKNGKDIPDDDKPYTIASDPTQPQGDLIAPQYDDLDWGPYSRTVVYNPSYNEYKAWTEIVGRDYAWGFGDDKEAYADFLIKNGWGNDTLKFNIPVLHCEFEGSRQKDVLDALNTFSLGGSWCKKNFLFGAICRLLSAMLAPLALAAAAYAWATAKDGDPADALNSGTIGADDWVVARGRWAYDGGHDGWNEMHATRVVQKIEPQYVPTDRVAFKAYMSRWCDLLSEIPRVSDTGVHPLSPRQHPVYTRQGSPENMWDTHPDIDGCLADPEPAGVK